MAHEIAITRYENQVSYIGIYGYTQISVPASQNVFYLYLRDSYDGEYGTEYRRSSLYMSSIDTNLSITSPDLMPEDESAGDIYYQRAKYIITARENTSTEDRILKIVFGEDSGEENDFSYEITIKLIGKNKDGNTENPDLSDLPELDNTNTMLVYFNQNGTLNTRIDPKYYLESGSLINLDLSTIGTSIKDTPNSNQFEIDSVYWVNYHVTDDVYIDEASKNIDISRAGARNLTKESNYFKLEASIPDYWSHWYEWDEGSSYEEGTRIWTIKAKEHNSGKTRSDIFKVYICYDLKVYFFYLKCILIGSYNHDSKYYKIKRNTDNDYILLGMSEDSSFNEKVTKNYSCSITADSQNYSFNLISLLKIQEELLISFNRRIVSIPETGFVTYLASTSNTLELSFTFAVNNTSSKRELTINIYDTDESIVVASIKFIQGEAGSTDIPTEDPLDDEYYSGGEKFSCLDDNIGSPIDSTALLFKGNSNHIYKTFDLKDNRLFFGNYTSKVEINKIHDIVLNIVSDSRINGVEDFKESKQSFYTKTGGVYDYVPNMRLNSLDKRVFKKGESYLIGLVFLDSTGLRSDVYYYNKIWSPSIEPYINTITGKCTKPIYKITIPTEVCNSLYLDGIIGVLPVYALQNSHKIIAQGFLCPTLTKELRSSEESINALYSWYLRFRYKEADTTVVLLEEADTLNNPLRAHTLGPLEIQATTANGQWKYNTLIMTLNSPEVEVAEDIKDADLSDVNAKLLKKVAIDAFINNINILVSGKYLHSKVLSMTWPTNERVTSVPIWYGFCDPGTANPYGEDAEDYTILTNNIKYYLKFYVYPWLRNKMGGEGPTSVINTKKYFDTVILKDSMTTISGNDAIIGTIEDACIYRDFDTASIAKVGTLIYLGNTDYIYISTHPYLLLTTGVSTNTLFFNPQTNSEGFTYAGYNNLGYCYDPISIKYKTAPHIVIKMEEAYNDSTDLDFVSIILLEHGNFEIDSSRKAREYYTWIKCGKLVRIVPNKSTTVEFEEGDYFYGRFDSLRTYPYTNADPNSITEIVSGMLCSRVNLDARTDRNRGVTSAIVSPVNFNLFNPVYNLLNNYFTFSYQDETDISDRVYVNTIQWSLTKNYGTDIDDWGNIQDINSLDLDGDKGQIIAVRRNGNSLVVFLTAGIALILYNENTLIASTVGVPIEIANSGIVLGKRYLYTDIGCLNAKAICQTSSGIYFIDSINRTIYLLDFNGVLTDICTTYGMKSWGLENLTSEWICYYDKYALEVLFANTNTCLSFSDLLKLFLSFVSYEGIFHSVHLSERLYLFNLSTSYFDIWKKNASNNMEFFGVYKPCKVDLIVNPLITLDKIFSNIDYRADCFDSRDLYLANNTFTQLRVWNEYLDTGIINLALEGTHKRLVDTTGNNILSRNFPSNLKKKFRSWDILIPRSLHGIQRYALIQGSGVSINDIINKTYTNTSIVGSNATVSRDRIRNPWTFASFILNDSETDKIKVHDILFKYFV